MPRRGRSLVVRLLVLILAAGVFSAPGSARACGLTPPIGPNGLPAVCQGGEADWRLRAGITGGGTSTRIDFKERQAQLVQGAATATLDAFPTERLGLSLSGGAALGGHVEYGGVQHALLPGVIVGAGASYRLFGGRLPFVHGSISFSLARATTRAPDGGEASFTAKDWRVGLAVGMAIGHAAAPFAVARYFGAGTDWSVAGGHGADAFRYQVGVGSAFGLSAHWDALAEVAFLGERRLSLGVGYTF